MQIIAAFECIFLAFSGIDKRLIGNSRFNLYGQVIDAELRTHQAVCLLEHFLLLELVRVLQSKMNGKGAFVLADRPEVEVVNVVNSVNRVECSCDLVLVMVFGGCLKESLYAVHKRLPRSVIHYDGEEVGAEWINIPKVWPDQYDCRCHDDTN